MAVDSGVLPGCEPGRRRAVGRDRFPWSSSTNVRRALVLAAGAGVIAMAAPAWARGVAPRDGLSAHRVEFTLRDARVTSRGNRGTSAGVFSGGPFGHGAVIQRVTITRVSPTVATSDVTFTIFSARGTVRGTGRSTRTTHPDGTVTAVGTRTVTEGTGAYRDARGQLTFTASAARNGITTSRWTGSLRYVSGRGWGPPRAHKRTKHRFRFTTSIVAISSSGNPPLSGRVVQANLTLGTLAGKTLDGAGSGVTTFPAPGVGDTVGTVFGSAGSVNITITATGTPNPDESFSFHGHGRIKGGTGAYTRASGSFTEPRGTAFRTGPSTATFTGTITY